jgi:hypothetical protein
MYNQLRTLKPLEIILPQGENPAGRDELEEKPSYQKK